MKNLTNQIDNRIVQRVQNLVFEQAGTRALDLVWSQIRGPVKYQFVVSQVHFQVVVQVRNQIRDELS